MDVHHRKCWAGPGCRDAAQERADAAARRLEGDDLNHLLAKYHANLPSGKRVRALPQPQLACTSVTNWSLPLRASVPDFVANSPAALTRSLWRLTACPIVKSTT